MRESQSERNSNPKYYQYMECELCKGNERLMRHAFAEDSIVCEKCCNLLLIEKARQEEDLEDEKYEMSQLTPEERNKQ